MRTKEYNRDSLIVFIVIVTDAHLLSIKLVDLLSSLVFNPGQIGNSFIRSSMILSSQFLQVLILFTISTCQSSDISIANSNEIVRQGVGSYGTELILEEMSQVWLNINIVLFVLF